MKKEFINYDDEVLEMDEVAGTDIKINPDYYIHKALIKAQEALANDNLKEGFIKYRQFIEHIEVLCNSAAMLDETYYTELQNFKNSNEYQEIGDRIAKSVKLADKKLGLMMSEIFANKTATFKLKA